MSAFDIRKAAFSPDQQERAMATKALIDAGRDGFLVERVQRASADSIEALRFFYYERQMCKRRGEHSAHVAARYKHRQLCADELLYALSADLYEAACAVAGGAA